MSKRDIEEFVSKFQDELPRPGISELKIDWYDLDEDWPKPWPNGDKPGIYIFVDQEEQLQYIGKASSGRTLKMRLRAYFKKDKDGKCVRKEKKKTKTLGTRYVGLLGLPPEHGFEAPAIEEYLITYLSPPRNKTIVQKVTRKSQNKIFKEWEKHPEGAPDWAQKILLGRKIGGRS
jgi:hypothetical protein